MPWGVCVGIDHKLGSVFACAFDLIHQLIGVVNQRCLGRGRLGTNHNTDTEGDGALLCLHSGLKLCLNSGNGGLGSAEIGFRKQQGKFIPTESGKQVSLADAVSNHLGNELQNAIALQMPP